MTFDELRAANPGLGFAVYAYDPGGDLTLEIHDDGERFAFTGPTLQAAIDKAFPSGSGVPPAADPTGVVAAEPEAASTSTQAGLAGGTPEPNVFD